MDEVYSFELKKLQEIMAHRNISLKDLSSELSCSVRWLRLLFQGKASSPKSIVSWIDRLDTAVTKISDDRGGIPYACCGLGAYGAMINEIERGQLYG